jgi:hypothetical protein
MHGFLHMNTQVQSQANWRQPYIVQGEAKVRAAVKAAAASGLPVNKFLQDAYLWLEEMDHAKAIGRDRQVIRSLKIALWATLAAAIAAVASLAGVLVLIAENHRWFG